MKSAKIKSPNNRKPWVYLPGISQMNQTILTNHQLLITIYSHRQSKNVCHFLTERPERGTTKNKWQNKVTKVCLYVMRASKNTCSSEDKSCFLITSRDISSESLQGWPLIFENRTYAYLVSLHISLSNSVLNIVIVKLSGSFVRI